MDTKEFFKTHPSKKEVFQTSDGFLFHQECDAKNHGKTLTDKTVKKVTNASAKLATADVVSTTVSDDDSVIGGKETGADGDKPGSGKDGSEKGDKK